MKHLLLILIITTSTIVKAEQTNNFLDVGISKVKLGLLLQNWMIYDEKNTTSKSNFRIRRSEIKLSGSVQDKSTFTIMIDPAKSMKAGAVDTKNDNKVIQDYIVGYNLDENFEFNIGQFKVITTAEGLLSSSQLSLPERSVVGRTYGDRRDLGLKAIYKKDIYKVAMMISNGSKPNADDTNTKKDLFLRGDINPVKNLSLGAFSNLVDSKSSNLKWGVNLFWDNNPESFHFEYAKEESSTTTNVKKSNGYMFDVGYYMSPAYQLMLRYERLLFTRSSALESSDSTIGLNYYLKDSNSKVQLATLFLNNMNASNGSYDVSTVDQRSAVLYTLAFQMGF